MKYKVGDKVRIRSKEWMDTQRKGEDEFSVNGNDDLPLSVIIDMFKFAGQEHTISGITGKGNYYLEGAQYWSWSDDMLEDLDDVAQMKDRIKELEAELAQLKKQKIVYDERNTYIAIWDDEPYILKCSEDKEGTLLYTFVGFHRTNHRLSDTFESGQEALDNAQTCMKGVEDDEQPCVHEYNTGKAAMEAVLAHLQEGD